MKPINELSKEEILSGEIFEEILNEADEIKRADLISGLKLRAKELGVKSLFNEKLKTYQKIDKETKMKYKGSVSSNSAPPDSNIADVLQMLDYKIEYDKDGNEKGSKLQQTVRNLFKYILCSYSSNSRDHSGCSPSGIKLKVLSFNFLQKR